MESLLFSSSLRKALNPEVDSYSQFTLIGAVSGLISDAEFQAQISALQTPLDWAGYGVDVYPYWSAPVVTYAASLLAFARIDALL